MMSVQDDDPITRILFVCTANHCRSPMAELLLRQRAERAGLPWLVESAGTDAEVGRLLHPYAAELLEARGIATSDFRSRPATPELLLAQDLILPMTDAQRRQLIEREPRIAARTFTLRPMSRLLDVSSRGAAAHRGSVVHDLLRRAQRGRALTQPMQVDRDIADPMGHGRAAFERCLLDLDAALLPFL